MNNENEIGPLGLTIGWMIVIIAVIGAFFGIGALYAKYNVWSSSKSGQAELAQADYNRQVLVRTAQAEKQASAFKAEADVIRAKGVAKANKIIGQSLENNKDYLTWKFIDELPQNKNQIIYLPSNGKLPFTEAGRAVSK